jgi:outer membrane protein TolC
MSIINKVLFWPEMALVAVLVAGCVRPTVQLDTSAHTELLQEDRKIAQKDGISYQIIELTLEQAIERGYEKNLDARVAALEELSQQKNVTLAQLRTLPGVQLSGGYAGRSNDGASSSESIITGQQSLEPSRSTEMSRRVAALEVNWNLLDAALALADAAKTNEEVGVARERYAKVIQNVERDIYTAYWRVSAYQESQEKVGQLLSEARDQIEKLDFAASKKLISSDQAGNKMALLVDRERSLRDLHNQMHLAEVELKSLLSLPMNAKLVLITKSRDISDDVSRLTMGDSTSLEWEALHSRPEMREEILKKNISIRDTHREVYQTFPGLSLIHSREYDSNKYLVDPNWANFSAKIVQTITGIITLPDRYDAAKRKEAVADARRQALNAAIIAQFHMARMRLASMEEAYMRSLLAKKAASRKSHAASGKRMQGFASGLDDLVARMELQLETMRAGMVYADYQDAYAAMKSTLGQSVTERPQKIAVEGAL